MVEKTYPMTLEGKEKLEGPVDGILNEKFFSGERGCGHDSGEIFARVKGVRYNVRKEVVV